MILGTIFIVVALAGTAKVIYDVKQLPNPVNEENDGSLV